MIKLLVLLCCQVNLVSARKGIEIDSESYVSFLADVRKYFKSTGIFLLYDDYSESFATPYNIAVFIKSFSTRCIRIQAIHYSKIKEKSSRHLSLKMQSLFVVFITSSANFDHFSATTAEHDMSFHTWLIVFTKFIDQRIYDACHKPVGNPFHLVFNSRVIVRCYNSKRLKKWYSVFDNRTEVLSFGHWGLKTGLVYKSENHYEKRFDLMGKTIRIATHTNLTRVRNRKMTGFFEDLFEELRNSTNFTVQRVKEEDSYGMFDDDTREWRGLVGFLVDREVDVIVAPMTLSGFRMEYIDYLKPLLLSRIRLYIKLPDNTRVQWSAYLKAFSATSWILLVLTLLMASMCISFIRISVKESLSPKVTTNYLVEHIVHVLGILCQQGLPEFPMATSLRLAYFTTILLALIVWAVYSATITSYITVLTPSLPFDDPKSFARDGTYKLIVLRDSRDYGHILAGTDPVLKHIQPFLKDPVDLPTDPYAGFMQVCNEKVGFYTSDAVFRGVSDYIPCSLTFIETGQYECLTIALTKRSPYITSLNFNLRKLEDNGVVKKLKNWYFQENNRALEAVTSPLGIESVAPLLAIFTFGFIISMLVYFLERIFYIRHEIVADENPRHNFQRFA